MRSTLPRCRLLSFPVLLLAAALLCGALAACQSQPAPQAGSASSEASSDTSSQSPERLILEALAPYAQGLEKNSTTSISYLLQEDEDRYFGAGRYSSGERYSLVIGLVNPDGTVAGSPFETGAYGGRPYLQTFWKEGQKYLLYTATGMQTGLSWGEAGLIRLDEDDFTWVWPVEGDIRDKQSAVYAEYQDYWTGHMPLMAPGGVEVFADSGASVLQGEGPQWVPDHNEQFFPSDYDALPIPVPYQVRVWLEDYTAQPVDVLDWANWEGWEDLVYLLREDKATDTALYGVVEGPEAEVPHIPVGILLRHGSNWRFHPLDWSGSQWEGVAPELFVGDFNGDGTQKAALSILTGHGTGVHTYSLTLFDLNTLERSDLDCSTLSYTVVYDPGTCHAMLDTGKQQATLNLRDYTDRYGAFTGVGSASCSYALEGGVLWGSYSLYVTFEELPPTLAYLVDIRAPVVCADGQWQLGEGDFLRQNPEHWGAGLESVQWSNASGTAQIARSQEELLTAS